MEMIVECIIMFVPYVFVLAVVGVVADMFYRAFIGGRL